MQDLESQSDVNPGIVEQGLDGAPVEREGMQGSGGVEREGTHSGEVEREGLRGGSVTEREGPDGGQVTEREAFDGAGQTGGSNLTDHGDPMSPADGSSR